MPALCKHSVEPSSQAATRPKENTSGIAKAQAVWLRLVLFEVFQVSDFKTGTSFGLEITAHEM